MAKQNMMLLLFAFLSCMALFSTATAMMNPLEVAALEKFYISLSYPRQLTGWRLGSSDPCGENWTGILCSGTSILSIKIPGLNISGVLSPQLNSFVSLKELDVSHNLIRGEIPFYLPHNLTHINLSSNRLIHNIPLSLVSMKSLCHLNLSHNSLSGSIKNRFHGLRNLKQLDLSYNHFGGNLTSSFRYLTSLTSLYLQNNHFTGSINFLEGLPLTDLNIRNNHFSGVVPKKIESIPKLSIQGNMLDKSAGCPPQNTALANRTNKRGFIHRPNHKNNSYSESVEIDSIWINSSLVKNFHYEIMFSPVSVVGIVGISACVTTGISILLIVYVFISRQLGRLENLCGSWPYGSWPSLPDRASSDSPEQLPLSSPLAALSPLPSPHDGRTERSYTRRSFIDRSRSPMTEILYNVADLQAATNNFSKDNLLGEGTIGSIYKAVFPDGQIFAVNRIDMAPLSPNEESQFLDVVSDISCLRHPNIVCLLGYCVEQKHLLVYENAGNFSLHDALHNNQDTRRQLTWNARMRIAVGIARVLEFLHLTCSPPIAHGAVTAANILLDDMLLPHVRDCGLANLRPLTRIKLEDYEAPICFQGKTAPEFCNAGVDKRKCDIYEFGVLLLELLTGNKPFDSSRARGCRFLVKWASNYLHDSQYLISIIDPSIEGQYSYRSLSQLANAISLCIQHQPDSRPTISEIYDILILSLI